MGIPTMSYRQWLAAELLKIAASLNPDIEREPMIRAVVATADALIEELERTRKEPPHGPMPDV